MEGHYLDKLVKRPCPNNSVNDFEFGLKELHGVISTILFISFSGLVDLTIETVQCESTTAERGQLH